MITDEKYDLIFNSLQNGTVEDWERLSQQFSDFPCGYDDPVVPRDWVTNAIDCGSLECVRWMISKGVNLRFIDAEGYTPLLSCIDRELSDKYEILQLLIDNGADTTLRTIIDDYSTAEQEAVILGKREAAELIRTYKAKTK